MFLSRRDSKLIIDDYSEAELNALKNLCFVDYRRMEQKKTVHEVLNLYSVRDGEFITCMGFLYAVKMNFPDCEIDIDELPCTVFSPQNWIPPWGEQQKAICEWIKNGRQGTLESSTASGKTHIATYAMLLTQKPTLIVVPTDIIQSDTWFKTLVQKFQISPERIGLFGGRDQFNRTNRQIRDITISTYKSAAMRVEELADRFELLIADETHHIGAPTYRDIAIKMGCVYRLGVSATVDRQDKNEELIIKLMGPRIMGASEQSLVDNNRISEVRHHTIFVDLTERERKKYNMLIQMSYHAESVGMRIKLRQSAARLAFEAVNKIPIVAKIVMENPNKKIIIFAKYISNVELMQRLLQSWKAEVVSSHTNNQDTLAALDRFHRGETRILLSPLRLDEGLNVPDADIGIVMAGHGVSRQKIQRMGRIRRYLPAKVAEEYEIVTRNTDDESAYWKRLKATEKFLGRKLS